MYFLIKLLYYDFNPFNFFTTIKNASTCDKCCYIPKKIVLIYAMYILAIFCIIVL